MGAQGSLGGYLSFWLNPFQILSQRQQLGSLVLLGGGKLYMKLTPPRKCCSGEAQRMDVVNPGKGPLPGRFRDQNMVGWLGCGCE